MLSLDLFDSKYERELREGAVDDLEYRRMNDLREKMEYLMQAYRQADTDEVRNAIMARYNEYKTERESYMKVREQQVPSKQDPFAYVKPEPKGIGDVQDPKVKMAQLAQQAKKGPLANVAAGLKAFVKGEPEPMGEEQQAINPRALGVANFQRLVKANMGNIPMVNLEFIRPEENFKLDQRGLDLISDYYDGLENDQAKNYFIYRVLPSGEETLKVLKQLGYSPVQAQQQQNLPGIPTQGELPLQEKKKSNNDDLEAGDIKVARELQKLRAEYPAARSDVEAVARAEIDSTERSQRQLSAIRGANEKQDALLKQLVALDQEQGREISGLDKENNSLEQRLAQVQATNDRLQQAIGTMTGTKKAATKTQTTAPQGSADVTQGGIIDVGAPISAEPVQQVAEPKDKSTQTKSAMGSMARQLTKGFSSEVPLDTINPAPDIGRNASNDPGQQPQKRAEESRIKEHGGGIGPRQHWQDLMQETVSDVKSGMARIYRKLAPRIERHRDSFLAGQLYDELENYAELHGAEREFKQMMNSARNRAHMEYDTNPGGFHNWFWFLPFEDNNVTEMDKSQPSQERHGNRPLGAKGTTAKPVAAKKLVKDLAMDLDQAFSKEKQVKKKGVKEDTDDVKKRMSKLEALALAANRAGDDAKCKMYQQKIQALKQKLSQSMAESSKPGEYYLHTVYFKDGTKKRIRVTSDEFDVADYYTKRGQAVDRVDYDYQIHSDMTEQSDQPGTAIPRKSIIQGYTVYWNPTTQMVSVTRGGDSEQAAIEQARVKNINKDRFLAAAYRMIDRIEELAENITREPKTARERDDMIDKIQRMMGLDPNPANKQIMKADIEMLKTKYRDLKEDSDGGEAVEMAIMRRMLVAHTDLIVEFGLDRVVAAIEEVAYDVGDTDEIGSSDVSGWVRQVERILEPDNEV